MQAYQQQYTLPSPPSEQEDFVLPLHSAELGSLPLHSPLGPLLHGNGQADANGVVGTHHTNGAQWYPASSVTSTELPQPLIHNSFGTLPPAPVPNFDSTSVPVVPQNSFPIPPLPQQHQQQQQQQHDLAAIGHVPDDSIENLMAAVNMDQNAVTSLPNYSDNDTLAMWSTAPSGFE